ncbi:MAG: hypothetical protein HKN25_16375 [Pyrinomonadaceae bacterium]|nr:hypothetical protein [Pyrinomonadaceae bacterium]
MPQRSAVQIVFGILLLIFFSPSGVEAQRNDHLTKEEIELVSFNQELDKRIEIYVKAIERRFLSLNGTSSLSKKELKRLQKDSEKWGEIPNGSQTKLLSDIDRIIDEAISKIEDVADRNMKSDLLAVAVYKLSDSARSFIPRLEAVRDKSDSAREVAIANNAISLCQDVIAASSKLERPTKKKNKKKKKNS